MLVLLKKTVIDMNEKGTVQLFEKQNLLHDALLLLVRHQFAHEHLFHGHLFWQPTCLLEVFVNHFDKDNLTETSRTYFFNNA